MQDTEKTSEINKALDGLAAKWPSSVVARRSFKEFSGGMYGKHFLANADWKKEGPEGGFQVGGQKVYPVESAIAWLKSKAAASWAERKIA